MAQQALNAINEAEERSLKLIEKAQADAAKLIADANKKAEADLEAAAEKNIKDLEDKKAEAAQKARGGQDAFTAETKKLCAEMEQKLLFRQHQAVDKVIKTISEL